MLIGILSGCVAFLFVLVLLLFNKQAKIRAFLNAQSDLNLRMAEYAETSSRGSEGMSSTLALLAKGLAENNTAVVDLQMAMSEMLIFHLEERGLGYTMDEEGVRIVELSGGYYDGDIDDGFDDGGTGGPHGGGGSGVLN